MKYLSFAGFVCIILGILAAGCTSPSVSPPATTPPTTVFTPEMTPSVPATVSDSLLLGTWTLREMGIQGGQAVVDVFRMQGGQQEFHARDDTGCAQYMQS